MNKIEIKAYVNGRLVAETGLYDLQIAIDRYEEDSYCIGQELLEEINKSFTVEAEEMDRNDYHKM